MDRRRRQYVPISSRIAFTRTGTALLDRWDMEGLCAWMLFLAACKRELVQGELVYTSDEEAWTKIGAEPKAFTLDEFFSFTGRLKQTRRTRHGRITYAICTRWKEWNNTVTTELKREQKSRSRGENAGDIPDTLSGHEGDSEYRSRELPPPTSPAERIFDHWKSTRSKSGSRLTDNRRRKINTRLATFSEDDLVRAIDGVAFDPWEERSLQDDLTIIFRSDEQVEKFLALAANPPARNGRMSEADIRSIAESQQ